MTGEVRQKILHASTVAFGGRAVLIQGAAGAGKSSLALDLISRGGQLIADDRTIVTERDGVLIASAPENLAGRIEARGVGILAAEPAGSGIVVLAADLDRPEPARLPERRKLALLDVEIDLILAQGNANIAPAIHLYLLGGRTD